MNIDKDIEIEGFEGEKIKCSPFTEKVGKDIIDYKYEYEIHLKVIDMFSKKLSEKERLLELANNKINELVPLKNEAYEKYCEMSKELETYKKIAKRLAKEILSIHNPIFNMVTVNNMEILIENARKEVEKDDN